MQKHLADRQDLGERLLIIDEATQLRAILSKAVATAKERR